MRRLLLTLLIAVSAQAADWTVVAEKRAISGNPALTESVWRASRPGGAYDKIEVHRYSAARPGHTVFLYLPGTNMNGEIALTEERYNLWLYLANRGYDVYTLDYRTHFVPAQGVTDFSFMAGWTYQTFVDDIAEASALAKKTSGVDHLVLAGFSRGVSLAYFYAAGHTDLCGLAMLDGGAKNPYAKSAYDASAAMAEMNARKNFAADVSGALPYEKRQELMDTVSRDPNAPATDGRSPNLGKQLETLLYNAWAPVRRLANPVDGFSRGQVLAKLLGGYDRYYPQVQTIESAAIADYPGDHAQIKDIDVPVIAFQSTGMGSQWVVAGLYTAGLTKNPDLSLHVLQGFGHLDVVVGEKAQELVFVPLERWLAKRTCQ
jgi:pimeloyl-ACP methyl ester carboxylesterase